MPDPISVFNEPLLLLSGFDLSLQTTAISHNPLGSQGHTKTNSVIEWINRSLESNKKKVCCFIDHHKLRQNDKCLDETVLTLY